MLHATNALNALKADPGNAARCSLSDLLRWSGLPERATPDTDALVFSLRRVRADAVLIHEGQPLQHLYVVGAGSLKCVQTDAEGYEQVLGFAIHGDLLGLDAVVDDQHASGVVALEDSTVAVLPYREVLGAAREQPGLAALLQHGAGMALRQRGAMQYLMSAASSEVRVARFLLHFAQRLGAMGHSDRRLRLRMTRREIASSLGVAHETVSRGMTALAAMGCIRVSHRDVEIVDAEALRELQRCTRGAGRGMRAGATVHAPRMDG